MSITNGCPCENSTGIHGSVTLTSAELVMFVALCTVIKVDISEWPFIMANLREAYAVFMLSNQYLDMQ